MDISNMLPLRTYYQGTGGQHYLDVPVLYRNKTSLQDGYISKDALKYLPGFDFLILLFFMKTSSLF